MPQVYALKKVANKAHSSSIPETDSIIAASIQRLSGGAASLWDDANVTTITIGGGAAQTSMTIGKSAQTATFLGNVTVNGSLVVSGTVTTINTTNMTIQDRTILISSGASVGVTAALAVERGSTGDDALLYWNEGSTRWEVGFFDTTAGTTNPTGALTTYSNFRLLNLSVGGTAITADAALTITATGGTSDLTFSARGASITLNQSGNTTLNGGFTATSIIGAINELYTSGSAAKVANSYTNGEATTIAVGTCVYIFSANTVKKASAADDTAPAQFIGVVRDDAGIASSASGAITSEGVNKVAFAASLTLNAGDEVFLSSTSGFATNVAPGAGPEVALSIGFVKDAAAYTGTAGDTALVQLVRGSKSKN